MNVDIPRYNHGFHYFGPLEQCEAGKLMKAKEVLPVLERLIEHNEYLKSSYRQNVEYWRARETAAIEQRDAWRNKHKALLVRASLVLVGTIVACVLILFLKP